MTVTRSEQSSEILSFVLMVPQEFHKMGSGLLGSFSDDISDDLTYPDGSMLEVDSLEEDIYDFGQACEFFISAHHIYVGLVHSLSQ